MSDQNQSSPTSESIETNSQEAVNTDEVDTSSELEANSEETSNEEQEASSKASPSKEQKKANNKKKLKLKVDGKEFEEEIDLDDDEYLTRQLQLSKAAQKRMAEAAQLQKEVEAFVADLRKNPRKVLSDPNVGVDIKKMIQEYIDEEIANSQKTPEQIEKEKLEAELKALREEREKEKEEGRRKELERIKQESYERYETQMIQAIESTNLPKKAYVVNKVADYLIAGLQQGIDLNPKDVMPLVEEEIREDLRDMISSAPDEVVEALIGKDVFNRIRKKNLQKAKQAPQGLKSVKDTGTSEKMANQEEKPVQKKTIKEFLGV